MRTAVRVICSAILCFVAIESCTLSSNPRDVLTHYLTAVYKGKYRDAYAYIAAQDRAVKTAEEYMQEQATNPAFRVALALGMTCPFTLSEVSTNNQTAVLRVSQTVPDMKAIINRFEDTVSARVLTEDEFKKLTIKDIQKKLQGQQIPLTTIHETYTLIKEVDSWKVFFDWKKQLAEQRKQDTINTLLAEASQLRRTHNYEEALRKYNEVLAIDNSLTQAQAEKAEVEKELNLIKEKQQYLSQIQLLNIRIERQRQRGSDTLKDSIIGTIVNKGERTLAKVKIAAYFLDAGGNEINYPSLASEFSFISDNQLLTPGSKKDFGFTIEGYAPPEWSGAVRVKITDIEFSPLVHFYTKPDRPTPPSAVVSPSTTAVEKTPPVSITPTESLQHMPRYHVVKPNETVFGIANRYGLATEELYRLNNLRQNQNIKPGQKLLVAQ